LECRGHLFLSAVEAVPRITVKVKDALGMMAGTSQVLDSFPGLHVYETRWTTSEAGPEM